MQTRHLFSSMCLLQKILTLVYSHLAVYGTPRSEHQLLLWLLQQRRCRNNHLPISIRLHPLQRILFLLFNRNNYIPSKYIQFLQRCHRSLEFKPRRSYLLSQALPHLLSATIERLIHYHGGEGSS